MNPEPLEKCRPCGGIIVWTGQEIWCPTCGRNYDFIAKEHGIALPEVQS